MFFCQEILPALRARRPNLTVKVVGHCTAKEQLTFAEDYGVELTGYVDDVRPYLAEASCLAVPLLTGGGTRLKITTAWAAGLPVVATPLGCEGLAGRDGEHLSIAADAEPFALAVDRILSDPDFAKTLTAAGRELAETRYSWTILGAELSDLYLSLLGQKTHHGP